MTPAIDDELLAAVSSVIGEPARLIGPTGRGESRSTHRLALPSGEAILKVAPGGEGGPDGARGRARQDRLLRIVADLRRRGSPVPEYLGAGASGALLFTVQRRLPGRLLEPGPGERPDAGLVQALVPELRAAVERQRDAGDLSDPPWPGWLLGTIDHGGDGYCLHDTLRADPTTAALLARVQRLTDRNREAPARTSDVVHFDLNPANILHASGRLSGIIDWNVPFDGATQGDRGFDVATLLFYTYDVEATREHLWAAALDISGLAWTAVHLAHLALRQVEWSIRHDAPDAGTARFLSIATHVLDELERRGA